MISNNFEWNSIDQIPKAPRWLEIIIILIGIPIIAISLYFIIPGLFEDITKLICLVIVITLASVGIITADRPRKKANLTGSEYNNLHIKVDENTIACNFRNQTNIVDLHKIDWNVTRITPEKLTKSLVIAELGKEEFAYPIFYMKEADRRKMWKSIIKHRPC